MDDDLPPHLGFEESATPFVSASQNARVWTEQWVHAHLFCPNCGQRKIERFVGNRPVADFYCGARAEEFELKSQKGQFGRRVIDGAFRTMCERPAANNNPSLILMNYDLARFYPGNRNVRPKIRQQLQVLRDQGFLQFTARGRYRVTRME